MSKKVTLKGMLSLSVGTYRFQKDQPVVVDDEKLLKYVSSNPWFVVEDLKVERRVKSASRSASAKPSAPTSTKESSPDKTKGVTDEIS